MSSRLKIMSDVLLMLSVVGFVLMIGAATVKLF